MKLLLTVLTALVTGLIGVVAGMVIEHHRLNSLLKSENTFR